MIKTSHHTNYSDLSVFPIALAASSGKSVSQMNTVKIFRKKILILNSMDVY